MAVKEPVELRNDIPDNEDSSPFLLKSPNYNSSDGDDHHNVLVPEAHATWQTAGQLMVADIVGVGVLSLPSAMANLGWAMGILFIILFFPLNIYTGILLWRVRLAKPKAITYMDMGHILDPPKEANKKSWLSVVSAVFVYIHVWLTLGDYTLVLGESLGLVFYDVYICKREWIIIGCLCILPFAQFRSLNDLSWLCWVNMGTITATIAVALGYCIDVGSENTLEPGAKAEIVPEDLNYLGFATAFSKIAFAYAGQFLYLEIMAEMKNPREFPKAFYLSGPYQLGMYLISACVGYKYKGNKASGLMINYVKFNGILRFAAILLFIHMIVTYLVKASVLTRALHVKFSPSTANKKDWEGRLWWFFFSSCLMISCVVVANAIPFFDSLTGLIGALLVPIACWNLPIIYYYLLQRTHGVPIPRIELPFLILIFVLGIVLTGVGTYSNMKDIYESWEKYGLPFSCACEHVWNTCACSPEHTGMNCE